jgi:hypothetical protein
MQYMCIYGVWTLLQKPCSNYLILTASHCDRYHYSLFFFQKNKKRLIQLGINNHQKVRKPARYLPEFLCMSVDVYIHTNT